MTNHNSGKIINTNGLAQWQTKLEKYTLNLDIVSLPGNENGHQMGIASFVVMEQDQNFLDYVGKLVAQSILKNINQKALLVTAESKGSHFVPWVWQNIKKMKKDKVYNRIITLRKGKPKVYMNNPVSTTYQSITSTSSQKLNLPPKDNRFLKRLKEYELVFVDDFIGKGGTMVAVYKLFEKLNTKAPNIAAVIGSDSNLYQKTLKEEKINLKILPNPFPLKLPTFYKNDPKDNWQIK